MTTNEPPPPPDDSTPSEPPSAGSDASGTSGLPSYGSTQPPAGETPPPPPPPPPAPGGSAETFSAPDAIGWGWRKFTENVGPILIGVAIVVVVTIVVNVLAGLISGGGGSPFSPSMDFSIAGLLASLVSNAVGIVLGALFARAALDVVDGQPFDFIGAFGRLNFVNVIVAAVLVAIIVTIGFVLLVIPGIIAVFLTYFTTLYVVDDDATSPVDAITDSVKLVSSNVGDSLLLALLNVLVLIAGAIALLVGLVVAYPVVALASAYAYRRFRGQPTAA